jgi:uncharacterized repeat protein (TIGR03803 family)
MTRNKRQPAIRWLISLAIILATASAASASWKEKVLYSFQGGTDGATPVGGVVFDSAGNLYGATQDGGSSVCHSIYQCGTVYQLKPPAKSGDPWTETILHVFRGNAENDGASPFGGLVIDSAGNLYGTTAYGGTGDCVLLGSKLGCGAVFELSPPTEKGGAWTETVLYSFPTSKQGYVPWGDLVFDKQGNLYGSTIFGGGKGTTCDAFYQYCGAVFELSPPKTKGGKWTEKVLHSFAGGSDGAEPNGGLLLDSAGNIYGTTLLGGSTDCQGPGCGTVFELEPRTNTGDPWSEKIMHRFTGGDDGASPNGGPILDAKGSLYGAAGGGGRQGAGVVFRLTAESGGRWIETVLHGFQGGTDGSDPQGLVFDSYGNLYCSSGPLVKMQRPKRTLDVLYEFRGAPNGRGPLDLIFGARGALYGPTLYGGTGQSCQAGCGTVFEARP